LGARQHERPKHDPPEAGHTERRDGHRPEAERRLADREREPAVQHELGQTEDEEQRLADDHEDERDREVGREHRRGVPAVRPRDTDAGDEHRSHRTGSREQHPDRRIEREGGGTSASRRGHQSDAGRVRGIGTPLVVETGHDGRAVIERDAHLCSSSATNA
jgi:hypothetical protein